MYERDLENLVCPQSLEALSLRTVTNRDPADGEILDGELVSPKGKIYPIVDGIPRFTENTGYNPSWDFKWTEIDRGEGLNYRMIKTGGDNIFDANSHGGVAYRRMKGGLILDIGCGVGQYSIKALRDYGPDRVVSVDLTRGVDVFRKIVLAKYPELKSRIVFVQASVFALPFRPETFDYVFSLGVLHHTGSTVEAIRKACSLVKQGGQINIWVYAPLLSYTEAREPGHRHMAPLLNLPRRMAKAIQHACVRTWMRFFRMFSVPTAFRLVKPFASDAWYRFCDLPVVGILGRVVFPGVYDPDYRWRLINIFDAYVNSYAENWSEHELFPVFTECGITVLGLSQWRCGLWGEKTRATPSLSRQQN
jgi:SAM-dependent methyltransferase